MADVNLDGINPLEWVDKSIHWRGANGDAPCKPVTGWDGPLHPQRKYVTCPMCRAAAYAPAPVEQAVAEAEPLAQWLAAHPPGAQPPRVRHAASGQPGAGQGNTALQMVRDAFSSVDCSVELIQDESGDPYFCVEVLDTDGTALLQLTVEDLR